MKSILYLATAMMFVATPAFASSVPVASYDMPNGGSGSYHYWDLNYTGAGATSTDGAALSGGLGDLTDGVVAPAAWYVVENGAGTGPWVGWNSPVTLNPIVTFNFSGAPTITAISVHLDNSGAGGVFAPTAILIDGISTAFTAPAGTFGWVNFTGLNLTGGSHTLQFNQSPGQWVFVSEVTFDGQAGAVPEPASWALMIAGFALVGATLRRRRMVAA